MKDILLDPNYSGHFFRQVLPDGTIVETKDRIAIGYKHDIGTGSNSVNIGKPAITINNGERK